MNTKHLNKINPILDDIRGEFHHQDSSGWAVEYRVVIADKSHPVFNVRHLRSMPSVVGYNFWLVVRNQGFADEAEEIDADNMKKALVMDSDNPQKVRNYLSEKINSIGEVSWDEFTSKATAFMDISDIKDDAREDTKGT